MSLLLTITAAPASVSISESSKTFDFNGGTLGRGKDNTWVLRDPERFLSSLHCQISSENGQYYLTDLSTNGTFMNGTADPMGKGCKLPLNDGDKFMLGEYEFSVSLWNSAQMSAAPATGLSSDMVGTGDIGRMTSDPFAASTGNSDFDQPFSSSSSPFDNGYVVQSEPLFSVSPEETDPLLALDIAQGEESFGPQNFSDPFNSASYSDQADPMNQQISWPETAPDRSGGIIPDDWDDDLGQAVPATSPPQVAQSAPPSVTPSTQEASPPVMPSPGQRRQKVPQTTAASQMPQNEPSALKSRITKSEIVAIQRMAMEKAMKKANEKVAVELEKLKKQMQSQQSNRGGNVTVDTSLIDTLGFDGQNLTDDQVTQINAKAGEVIRESVKGLMQVLSSRSAIKNEFRMNVTTIQPVENNPLKFSANVDDALENMFIKQGNAYKKPIEAVQEGFDSIAAHQVAIIAGIRAAFKSVIERFDPIRLEERFTKGSKAAGLIPGMQKAKNWDLYNDYYTELAGDLDNSFQYLFGDEFVQAYEDQLRKLSATKKSKSKDK